MAAQIGDGSLHGLRSIEHDFGRHVGLRGGAGDVAQSPC